MSKIRLLQSKEFMAVSIEDGHQKRFSDLLANINIGVENMLTEEQRKVLPAPIKPKLTRRNLLKFIAIVKRSPYFYYDDEEEEQNIGFVASFSDDDMIRLFDVYEYLFFKHFKGYYQDIKDRRKKARHVSRAAGSLKLTAEIKKQAEQRGIKIDSRIFK